MHVLTDAKLWVHLLMNAGCRDKEWLCINYTQQQVQST